MAFATVDDLAARWRALTEDEEERAAVLLDDAAVMLSALVHVDPNDAQQAELLKIVSCNMVERAMLAGENNALGVTQASVSADIYSQSWTFSNPSGDMYLTKNEKRLLGIATGYIGSIEARIAGPYA